MKCPQGTVSKMRGNPDPSCSKCPAGSYQFDGDCVGCQEGSFSRAGEAACSPCLLGTFSLENATGCEDCAAGSYSSSNYSSECSLCKAGTFAEFVGLSECLACPIGYVSDKDGAKSCLQCLYGQYAASGSSSVSPLFFLFGVFFDHKRGFQCSMCPKGSWSIAVIGSDGDCTDCGAGKYSTFLGSTASKGCVSCAGGKFSAVLRADKVSLGG
jgi:pyruvate/2-oxoacid:ferredoxin oxidoreductase beta subunit